MTGIVTYLAVHFGASGDLLVWIVVGTLLASARRRRCEGAVTTMTITSFISRGRVAQRAANKLIGHAAAKGLGRLWR